MAKKVPKRPKRRHEPLGRARERMAEILDRLQNDYAGLGTALHFENPLQLLVATILSAQCTDDRVNMVTPALFQRFPDVESLAGANPEEMERMIYTTGFFRNKTKSIVGAAAMMIEVFEGQVPSTMADLIRLPGVSRKTGNVVLSHAFGRTEGIAVDTHVFRVSRRLDLSRALDPEGVEADLMKLTPQARWSEVADTFIWHGRRVCQARVPRCLDCRVLDLCPYGRRSIGPQARDRREPGRDRPNPT